MIKHRGYNNDSGILYKTCGTNQYKGKNRYPNNKVDTADYKNSRMEKKLLSRMNDNMPEVDVEGADQLTNKEVKRVEVDMELKSNPSMGNDKFRIDKTEQMSQKISADTAKRNMMVNEDFQKIPPLKYNII